MRLFKVNYRLQDKRWHKFNEMGLRYQTRYAPTSGHWKLVAAESPKKARDAVLETDHYQEWFKTARAGYADWYGALLVPAVTSSELQVIWA